MEIFIDNIMYIALISTILISAFLFFKRPWTSYYGISNHDSSHEREIKLRAYERLIVFLERIEPVGMINRLELHHLDVNVVHSMLIKNIVIEYEYNVSQQVYVSDNIWEMITVVKNKIINNISNSFNSLPKNSKTDHFVQIMLKTSKENSFIINHAKKSLKKELRSFL